MTDDLDHVEANPIILLIGCALIAMFFLVAWPFYAAADLLRTRRP